MTHNGKPEAGGAFVELLIGVAVALVVLLVTSVATSQATQQAAKIREENSLEDTHSHISEHFYNDFASAGQDVVQLNTEPANSTTYFDEVTADAPKLYWRLDEPAGVIRVADSSPHGLGGAVSGAVNFAQPGGLVSDADYAVSTGALQTGPSSTDLALGKPAFESSNPFGGAASRAVDGNTDGNWSDGSVTHTNLDQYAWWYVDLGSSQQISTVKIWNRTDCCQDRLSNFYVFAFDQIPASSTGPAQTATLPGVSSYYVTGPVGNSTTVAVNRSARYVAVQLAGTNYLSLAEVQVFGVDTTPTPGGIYSDQFPNPAGDFSVEWWLKPTRLINYNQVITDAGWGGWVFHATAEGSLYCGTDSSTNAIGPATVPAGTIRPGEWHHFVFTYHGSTGSLYLNGKLLDSRTLARPQNFTHLNIETVEGTVDEVAMYDSALSQDRVRAHYIAGVAPPPQQRTLGLRVPPLPLAKWPGTSFARPAGPVSVTAAGDRSLIISGDPAFSPTQTQAAFTASGASPQLVTRKGVRGAPSPGDYLLVIDYEALRSVLVKVAAPATEGPSPTDPDDTAWTIPVEPVTTANAAWGMLASADVDTTYQMPEGSAVVRLLPPVSYSLSSGRLVRTSGQSDQTLALGVTSLHFTPAAGAGTQAWVIDYSAEGEAVEASSDENWNQKASVELTATPRALNPMPVFTN
jgi:Concanavalin A-like lectin/glucanases superfamily/F5/8 type C domain